MTRSKLCGPCRHAWLRWLDYRLPMPGIVLVAIGRQDVRHVQERAEARFRQWRDTVRFQQALIEGQCAAGHHGHSVESSPSVSPSSSPRSSSGRPRSFTTIDLPAT